MSSRAGAVIATGDGAFGAGEAEDGAEPGLIVFQNELAAVQPRDGTHQSKAETAAVRRTRLIETAIFSQRLFAQVGGDSGAPIRHPQTHRIIALVEADPDSCAVRAILGRA